MRLAIPWIALVAILGFACGGSAVWSLQTPNEQASHQQAGGAGDIKQHETFWERLTTDPVAVGTFILCFVTGVLAYVTYGLYRATTNLARDTRVAIDAALLASTEATKLAAKEFLSTHRPKIRVRKVFA